MPAKYYKQTITDLLGRVVAEARGMWRFRWLGILVAWTVCLMLWLYVLSLPPIYHASARIFVDTENAIKPLLRDIAISSNIMDEIVLVTNAILSRPNLTEVARQTGLDVKVRTEEDLDRLLGSLQQRITVSGSSANIYTIQFEDSSRESALAVVQSLVDTFVTRSLGGNRHDQSDAQQFLQDQIAEYETRLVAAEMRLSNFKRENVAFMPDKSGDYFSRLQEAQLELQKTRENLGVAEKRQAELQRQIVGEEPVFGIMPSIPMDQDSDSSTGRQIQQLEGQLENLRLQYTDKHPRINQLLESIEALKRQKQQPGSERKVVNPLDVNPVYQSMRIQLSNVEVEIATLRAQAQQQESLVSRLRGQVDTIPQVEASLNGLNRDYGVIQAKYEQLLKQLETANIGQQVDISIDEVQFQIIEPPFAESTPVGPFRPLFLAVSFFVSVGLALALTLGLNLLKAAFFDSRTVTQVTGLPVIGIVSMCRDKADRVRANLENALVTTFAFMLIVALILVTAYAEQAATLVRSLKGGLT